MNNFEQFKEYYKQIEVPDDDIGYTALGQGIASALHETQYTRLFRS